jgi:hypothetical protein
VRLPRLDSTAAWWVLACITTLAWFTFLCIVLRDVSHTQYRLVGPEEAKHMVNDEGWHISSRMRPTDTLVYVYHDR